jgi:PAS domain S-box-containing protein
MDQQLAVRRYLLISSALFVLGLMGLGYALVGEQFGNLLTREVLLAVGVSLTLAGGWQFWALAITHYRADQRTSALADELEMMASVAQHTGSPVIVTDAQHAALWVNESFCRVTGFVPAEVVGRQPGSLLRSPQADPAALARLDEAIQNHASIDLEVLHRYRDGRDRWVRLLLSPQQDATGGFTGFVTVLVDVDEQVLTREALRTSQDMLARTSRIAGVGSWYADLRSRQLYLSGECRTILGLGEDEASRIEDIWRHFDDTVREQVREQLQAMERLERYSVDLVTRMRGGEPDRPRWVRLVAELDWHGARTERIIGSVQDVSAQVRAQQRIEEVQRILRGAIEAVDEAFAIYDPQDRLVFANDKYKDLYAPHQAMVVEGARYDDIIRSAGGHAVFKEAQIGDVVVNSLDDWLAERLKKFQQPRSDSVIELSDGRWLRVVERTTSDGFHVGFRIDITQLQHALRAADAAAQSKGQFLANMSHEIRTPLNAVLGLLQLLRYTALTPEQGVLVHKTHTAARSLLAILNDILDFSKVEAGKMELHPEPFVVRQLMQELLVILSGALGEKQLELVGDIDPRIPPVLLGDALRLKQVLINLGGNAIKFTALGQVRVGLSLLDQENGRVRIRFSVQDTGIGIPPEQRQHIFSGFSQAEASTARRYGGTGLGLAISQRLVALMHGEITLDSTPGTGSVFAFDIDFPLATMAAPSSPASGEGAHPATGPRLSGLRLLLAEDNVLNQEVALAMLAREGAQVGLAGNGQQAVDLLAAQPQGFDLVLMDMQMPVLDGLQATQQIRQRLQLHALPIVAMTANAMPADRERCLAAGMHDHIGKPFDMDELVALILHWTGRTSPRGLAPAAAPALPLTTAPVALEETETLRRLGGDAALLMRLRTRLAPLLPAHLAQTRLALEQGDWAGAADLMHQLKSSAAAVGAQQLAQDCARAEQEWRPRAAEARPPDVPRRPGLLEGLETAVAEVLPLLIRSATATGEPYDDRPARTDLLSELVRLKNLLERADIEAVEAHEVLLAQHARVRGPQFAELHALMEQMDLLAAATEVARLEALIRKTGL